MLKIGHRGAAGTYPENTLASFRRAAELGCDGVELDIHRTRDGHLVVIHDFFLNSTTTGAGLIRDLTLAEVKAADAGVKKDPQFAGERVPTLEEVLDALPERMTVFIEVKAGSLIYPGIEPDLVALLQQHKATSRVQVSSFDHQALQRVHQLAPDLPLGMLTGDNRLDPVGDARAIGASAIHPLFIWVTPMLIEAAHAAGLQVNAWTINEPPFIAMYRVMGIDGIMSDFPERL